MKDYDEIRCRRLLESYYQGVISPEEQAELMALLKNPNIPADLKIEQSFFNMLDRAAHSENEDFGELDAMLSDMVSEIVADEKSRRWHKFRHGLGWIAAAVVGIVLLIGVFKRYDSIYDNDKFYIPKTSQEESSIESASNVASVEPVNNLLTVSEKQEPEIKKLSEPSSAVLVAQIPSDSVSDGITDEELQMANETIEEVQAFFNEMMAEWDNADSGVRGLLKNRGVLADSGEKEPEVTENQ